MNGAPGVWVDFDVWATRHPIQWLGFTVGHPPPILQPLFSGQL